MFGTIQHKSLEKPSQSGFIAPDRIFLGYSEQLVGKKGVLESLVEPLGNLNNKA
jgi:hypothetical protein